MALEKYLEVGKVPTYLPRGSGVLLVGGGGGGGETSKDVKARWKWKWCRGHHVERSRVSTICSQTCAGVPVVKFSHIEVVWAVGAFIKEGFISLKWEKMC